MEQGFYDGDLNMDEIDPSEGEIHGVYIQQSLEGYAKLVGTLDCVSVFLKCLWLYYGLCYWDACSVLNFN